VSAWKLVLLAIYWDQTRLEAQYIVVRQVENRVHTQTLKPTFILRRIRHDYGGRMNHKQPQKPDQCVNYLPGLKCKGSARLDKSPQI